MAKKKAKKVQPAYQPKARPRGGETYAKEVRARADQITAQVGKIAPYINRVLLVILLAVAILWMAGKLDPTKARCGILMCLGLSFALNGVTGYRSSRRSSFFLMLLGTVIFLVNLFLLIQ